MKRLLYMSCAAMLMFVAACSDDEDGTDPPVDQEFIAEDADFAGYRSWSQTVEPQRGPDPAGILNGAHNGNDSTMTRHIFISDASASRDANGNYPNGTRLVKEMRDGNGDVVGVTAMAKRGAGFNAGHRGWEWFMIASDGSILDRGADLFNNGCNGCHAAATSKDYVFTK